MKITFLNLSKHWLISGEHLYRRGLQLAVALLLSIWIILMWLGAEQRGEEVRVLHTEQLARVILSQATHEAKIWLAEDNTSGLEGLAHHLQSQDGILEVSIQDEQGRSIVRAGHDLPVQTYLTSLPTSMWSVPMVSSIDEDGVSRGFLRITFDYNRIMSESQIYQRDYLHKTGFMLFLAALAGALAATALLKRRPRPIPGPQQKP